MMPALVNYINSIEAREKIDGPFTLEPGRAVCFLSTPIASVPRVGNERMGYILGPAEVDDLAHEIVAALNERFLRKRAAL